MKIDIVTDTYIPDVNGVAMTLGRLVDYLRVFGHVVHVVHTGESAEDHIDESKVRSFALPGYSEVRIGFPSYLKLKRRWSNTRPDVIYVATESPLGSSALKAANSMDIPVAAGFHTNFHQYMKKYKLSLLKDAAMNYLRSVHDKADVTLTPSMDAIEMLEDSGFKNVKLLGRGVDTSLFSPNYRSDVLRSKLGARASDTIALIVGRIAPEKNLNLALKCLNIQQKESFPRLQIVVVGDGPYRKRLEENYPNVHFVGMQTGHDLATYYASSDVMLFPSETETFGNVLIEAMASRLVTVSYRYAASKIYIQDGENGFSAKKGDEEEYMLKVGQALKFSQNKKIRDAALDTVSDLSWKSVAEKFEGYLNGIYQVKLVRDEMNKAQGKLKLRSLFISDVHLGSSDSQTSELIDLLERVSVETIYLNGDIIDGRFFQSDAKWTDRHSNVIQVLLKKMHDDDTELIYLKGNHDKLIDRVVPFDLGGLKVASEVIHETLDGKKYLIVHGDGFDAYNTNHRWVAKIGAFRYESLLKVNRLHNLYRKWIGKDLYSISKSIKAKAKGSASFIEKYQEQVRKLALKKKCDGVIVGHIHVAADENFKGVHYLNSGDWTGSASCVVEYSDGKLGVLRYEDFRNMLDSQTRTNSFLKAQNI